MELLLGSSANPDCKTSDGRTPLHICCEANSIECARLLLAKDDKLLFMHSGSMRLPLHASCQNGFIELTELLLSESPSKILEERDRLEMTPLLCAVSGNHTHLVKILVENYNADATATDALAKGLLHYAAGLGNLEIIELGISLLGIEAATVKDCWEQWTPLQWAVKHGHTHITQYLTHLEEVNSK